MFFFFMGLPRKEVPEDDVDLVTELGLSLFGDRWQARFCETSGIATSQLSAILKRKQPLTRGAKRRIYEMLFKSNDDLIESAAYQTKLINASMRRFENPGKTLAIKDQSTTA